MSEQAKPVDLGIDIESSFDVHQAITAIQACQLIRGRCGPLALSVFRRWANPRRGCNVNGARIVLPAVKVGGMLLTMREWVLAFDKMRLRLAMAKTPAEKFVEGMRTPRQRERDHRDAMERLRAAGVAS